MKYFVNEKEVTLTKCLMKEVKKIKTNCISFYKYLRRNIYETR